jgi:hypothetical protein
MLKWHTAETPLVMLSKGAETLETSGVQSVKTMSVTSMPAEDIIPSSGKMNWCALNAEAIFGADPVIAGDS